MNSALAEDGTRLVQLSDEQFREIGALLERLHEKSKCKALALVDSSGLLIARHGGVNQKALVLLATLAAANYAATAQMARLIGEKGGFKMHLHEGQNHNIYISGVNDDYYLFTVFGTDTTFSLVRVLTAKATKELDEILRREVAAGTMMRELESVKQSVSEPGFQDELSARLDELLRSPSSGG